MSLRQTGLLTSLLFASFIFIFSNGDSKAGGFLPNFSFCRFLIAFLFGGRRWFVPAMVCMWSSKDNLCKSVLLFYHMGPDEWTQVIKLGGMCLYPLSHLICVCPTPPPFVVIETGLPCVAQVSLRQSMYIAHPPALAFQMLRLKACATIPGPFLCFFIWNKVSLSCLGEPWTPSVARQFLHFLFPLLQSYEWLGYHTCATRPS